MLVELARARAKEGLSAEADRWLAMLVERREECIATLDRDRMAVEVIFRRWDETGDWLYWFSIRGESGPENADAIPEDERLPIDRDHIAASQRIKESGWEILDPQLVLLPAPVEQALLQWLEPKA